MRSQVWATSALCAVALAAPTLSSSSTAERPAEMKIISEYFQLLSSKVQAGKALAAAPICDLSKASMPVASPKPLPPVGEGLTLKHVAVGRGTQNYTCDTTNATAIPVAVGAVATLYNASCIAATYPDVLAAIADVALQFQLTSPDQPSLTPSNLVISGHHFFSNGTTPVFDLDSAAIKLGVGHYAKDSAVPAPADASIGQNNKGHGAVAWLKLKTRDGATGRMQEVYRIKTAGGSPPSVCAGMAALFQVEYATEYWFYGL